MGMGKLEIEAMIYIKIMSGFGNQLFQYAAGLSLSQKTNTKLILDISALKTNQKPIRKYELENLQINTVHYGKPFLLPLIKNLSRNSFLNTQMNKSQLLSYYFEKRYGYNEEFENLRNNTYLDGYFQSFKYIEPINHLLKTQFEIKNINNKTLDTWKTKVKNQNSVGIHIRRTDYVNNSFYHSITLPYYKQAIDWISRELIAPVFYIFSDDPIWVKNNFDGLNYTLVETGVDLFDFEILKNCKHQIIANSTFSWWAAWLNQNDKKIIVCPSKWTQNHQNLDESLIYPKWKTF